MATKVKIEGLRELGAAMRALPEALAKKHGAKAVFTAAAIIKADAQNRVPIDTGRLEAAILVKKTNGSEWLAPQYVITWRRGKKAQHTKVDGDTVDLDAYYGMFVEFGTEKMAAEPFMRPAFETNKELCLNTIIDGLRYGVETEAAKLGPK